MNNKCGCWHHWGEKAIMTLVWVSGFIFFWTSLRMTTLWGYESPYYAWVAIVLSLMGWNMRGCGCCGGEKKFKMEAAMCTHSSDCKCEDCPKCA